MFQISIIFYIPLCHDSRLILTCLKVVGGEKSMIELHEKQKVFVDHYLACDSNTVIFSQVMAE